MKQTIATLQATSKRTAKDHIEGIANSLTTSRDGTLIAQEAAKQAIGKKVPLLLSHDWDSLPIGSATMTAVDEGGLHYDGSIFEDVDNRAQILEGIGAGVLSVSVGFIVQDMDKDGAVTGLDLLELSITPVPADSRATVTQELKFESEEKGNMDKDKDKNKTIKQATGDNEDPNATDTGSDNGSNADDGSDDAPTISDVMDAITALSKSFEDLSADVKAIKDAVAPDDSSDSSNGSGSDDSKADPAPTDTKQELDKAKAIMLQLAHGEQVADIYKLFSDLNAKI